MADKTDLERKQEFTREYGERLPKSRCRCNHTGDGAYSEHGGAIGHGPCVVKGCPCKRFTWVGWLPAFEKGLES